MTEEMLEDILNAIKALDRLMEERFNEMNTKFDKMLADMDHRFDRLEKKVDGIDVD